METVLRPLFFTRSLVLDQNQPQGYYQNNNGYNAQQNNFNQNQVQNSMMQDGNNYQHLNYQANRTYNNAQNVQNNQYNPQMDNNMARYSNQGTQRVATINKRGYSQHQMQNSQQMQNNGSKVQPMQRNPNQVNISRSMYKDTNNATNIRKNIQDINKSNMNRQSAPNYRAMNQNQPVPQMASYYQQSNQMYASGANGNNNGNPSMNGNMYENYNSSYNNNTNIQYYNDNNMNQRSVPMVSNSYAPRSPQKVMNQTNNYQQEMQYASMKRPMDVPETKQMKMTPEMSHQYKTMPTAQSTANPMNNQYGQMNTVPMMTPTPRSSVGPVTRDKQVSMTKNYGTAVPTPAPLYPTPQQQQPIRRLPMNTQSMKNENLNRAQKGQSGKASIPQPMTEKKQMYA